MTSYSPWKNIVLYQIIWFGSVLMQNSFVLPVVFLLGLHFVWCGDRRNEFIVVFLCASSGLIGDTLLTIAGVFNFDQVQLMYTIPLWLSGVWIGFAATLRHGTSFLMKRPLIAVLLSGVGAPFVYMAASRLGAVSYPLGTIKTAIIVSCVWMLQMCLFVAVVRVVARRASVLLVEPAST